MFKKKLTATGLVAAGVMALAVVTDAGAQTPVQSRGDYGATPVQYQADSPAAFMSALNAWRARHGRHPVGWDQNLAAWAGRNTGVHAPGSSGGASQCWASGRSYLAALRMWQASGPHASILLNARSAVGVSLCASGVTCNAR